MTISDLSLSRIRPILWGVSGFLGVVQTWYSRHVLRADGISYMAIADYYRKGDWHNALNDYWSPLYSWAIAVMEIVLHPSPYWQAATLHVVNLLAYIAAIIGFELFLRHLIAFQQRQTTADISRIPLSAQTLYLTGYSLFLVAALFTIHLEVCSPDIIAVAITFSLAYFLLKIESGSAGMTTFAAFGAALALGYLDRAAFAPAVCVYIVTALILLRRRRMPALKPLMLACVLCTLIVGPFITVLSVSRGHFTLGTAGKLNYAWEVSGVTRSVHWQGEPFNFGRPVHPTHKISTNPAIYTFAEPIGGSYPPWFEPSYWYDGMVLRFELRPQLHILRLNLIYFFYLFLPSPVTLACLLLIPFMGLRQWLSARGIFQYWFLLLPTLAYISLFCLVFIERRYIAGSLVLMWVCLLASLTVPVNRFVRFSNIAIQSLSVLFCMAVLAPRLFQPTKLVLSDLVHRREAEWNLNWMLVEKFRQFGLKPGDRIAYIGDSLNIDWPRLAGVRIIAEVPVTWERSDNFSRSIYTGDKWVKAFWSDPPAERLRILRAFKEAGAKFVVTSSIPAGADASGWQELLPPGTPHEPWSGTQFPTFPHTAFLDPDKISSPAP